MSVGKNVRRKNRARKPYRKSRAFDASCRPHGSCAYCYNSRMHKHRKQEEPKP
jgi:hypothetical protein